MPTMPERWCTLECIATSSGTCMPRICDNKTDVKSHQSRQGDARLQDEPNLERHFCSFKAVANYRAIRLTLPWRKGFTPYSNAGRGDQLYLTLANAEC